MNLPNLISCKCLSYLSHSDLFHVATAGKSSHPLIVRTLLFFHSSLSFEFIRLIRSLYCPISVQQWEQLARLRGRKKRKQNSWKSSALYFGRTPCKSCGRSTKIFLAQIRLCQRCQSNPRRKYSFHVCKYQALRNFSPKIVRSVDWIDFHPQMGYRYSWYQLQQKERQTRLFSFF